MKRSIIATLCLLLLMTGLAFPQMGVQRNFPPAMPTANLVASYSFGEGWNQYAFNKASTNAYPAAANYFGVSGGQFFKQSQLAGDGWNAGSVTLTDFYANDPNGHMNATRLVASGSSGFMYYQPTLPIGTFCLSVYAKSNTGLSQTMRIGDVGATSSTVTVTTSWTRFSQVLTYGSSTSHTLTVAWQDASNNPLDVLLYGARLEDGSTPTAYAPPAFDLQLGATPLSDSNDPTWTTAGLTLGASKFAGGISDIGISTTNVSMYAVIKKTGSDLSSGMEPIFSEYYGSSGTGGEKIHLASADQAGGSPLTNAKVPTFMFGGQRVEAHGVILNDSKYHVLTGTYDGTTLRLYLDGYVVQSKTVSISSQDIRRLYVGRFEMTNISTRYFPGDILLGFLYSSADSQATVQQNVATLQKIVACRGAVMSMLSEFLEFDGDSISDSNNPVQGGSDITQGWVYQVLHDISPTIQARNFAKAGSTLHSGAASILNRAADVDATCDPTRTFDALTILIGANDISSAGVTASDFVALLKSYALNRRTACPTRKIIIATLLPQSLGNPLVNPLRNSINSLIVADPSFYDALARLDLESHVGPDAAASDNTLYIDGLHPTALGQTYIYPVVKAAILSLRP